MDNFTDLNSLEDANVELDLDRVVMDVSRYYHRIIDPLLRSKDIFGSDDKNDLKKLLQDSRLNFGQIKKLLNYVKFVSQDTNRILNFRNRIQNTYTKRTELSQNLQDTINDILMGLKLPQLALEIASYLLNKGEYSFMNLTIRGVSNFGQVEAEVYKEMETVIRKKLCRAILPPDELSFNIKDGVLTIEPANKAYMFELTLLYNNEHKDFDWFLLSFEYKLEKITKLEKKAKRIQDEVTKVYHEDKRDNEIYIICYIVHKMKYYYTRKKLKAMLNSVDSLRTQLEMMGPEEGFELNQKKVSKEMVYFEICYWKHSLLHSLNPNHKFNRLIFQLINLPILSFIEQYQQNTKSLFSGLSDQDILRLSHEPSLPTTDSIGKLAELLGSKQQHHQHQDIMTSSYLEVQRLMLFGGSRWLQLYGLNVNNNFMEILDEVKALFQVYQLLYYYSQLCKESDRRDSKNIHLVSQPVKDLFHEFNPLKQNKLYISLEIEGNALFLYINSLNGRIDFLIEPPNKVVQAHKSRLKEILWKNPLKLTEIVNLYKKILLMGVLNNLAAKDNAKLYSQGDTNDGLKKITYKTSSMHITQLDGNKIPMMATFSNTIIIRDDVKELTIQTQFYFEFSGNQQKGHSLKKELTASLVPFDLRQITRKIDNLLKHLKYRGYYDLERRKSGENITDSEKPILQINSAIEQAFDVSNTSFIIKLKPSYPISVNYSAYINSHAGMKLAFNPAANKPKTFELYEKNRLTIRYATILDAYIQLKRDIQRLEGHISSYSFEKGRNRKDIQAREYHSCSIYSFSDSISAIFINDKITDVLPHRFQNFVYYHDQLKDEKDFKNIKEVLIKEIKQSLHILEAVGDLNQKKNEYYAKKAKAFQAVENGEQENKKTGDKIAYHYFNNYYTDIVVIDPWHFVIFWRSFFEEALLTFSFYFQLVSENEFECFGIYLEHLNNVDRERVTERHKWYTRFKDLFAGITANFRKNSASASSSSMNARVDQNSDQDQHRMRIRLTTKDETQGHNGRSNKKADSCK